MNKSSKNLLFSVAGQIITIAIGLILPRLYAVSYGSEVNGLINSVNQYIVYLGLFEAGIGTVTLQALYRPIALEEKDSINSILAATHLYYKKTGYLYLFFLVLFSLAYPFLLNSEIDYWTIFGVCFFSGISNVIFYFFQGKYRVLLQAEGKNYIITNLTTIVFVANGICKCILISLNYNVAAVLFVSALINLIQMLYILFYIHKHYKWINLRVEPNFGAISQRKYALVHQVSALIFQNTDVLILTVVSGLKVVSVYSIYKMVVSHLESFINIFINSVNYKLGQMFQVDLKEYINCIDSFESYYSAISFSLFSVAFYLFKPFVELYTVGITDINYVDDVLPLLFIVIALLSVMRTPMLNTINYAGHFQLTLSRTITETIINLTVSLVAVFWLGIYGVLIGTICALGYRTIDIIIYANRKILKRAPWKTFMIYAVNIASFFLVQFSFVVIFKNGSIANYYDFIIVGVLSTIISVMIFVIAQSIIFPRNLKTFWSFMKGK